VYILCNKPYGTLYIGFTNNLIQRVYQHKQKHADGFTKAYNVDRLVYWEKHQGVLEARYRERCLKKWNRAWKVRLIEEKNPSWEDLYYSII
jgi:putative endonuclease